MGTPRSVSGSGKSSSAVTLPAWVNSIVVNAYLDSRRRVTRHPTVSLEGLTEDMDDSSFSFLDSKEKSPLALLTEQEQRDILWRAIDRMPELQVEMLLRFYLEDHSYQEISEVMQMPLGTVKSRLNRARLALSRKLKAHEKVFIT
jgi:RNA polymerase sigma-70 factor (ECF subfamily)